MNRRGSIRMFALVVFVVFIGKAHTKNSVDTFNENVWPALAGASVQGSFSCDSYELICASSNKIEKILLSNRGLTGTIPTEIGDLGDLTHLDLSNNQLNGSIPSEIYNLVHLTHLDLSNLLEGPLPPLPGSLTHLYVQGNLLCDKSLRFSGRVFSNCTLSEDDTAENCFAGDAGTCSVVSQVNGTVCGGCTPQPTTAPTMAPTAPTVAPTASPTKHPTSVPTAFPTKLPTAEPTSSTVESTTKTTDASSTVSSGSSPTATMSSATDSAVSSSSSTISSTSQSTNSHRLTNLTSEMSIYSMSTSFGSNDMMNGMTTALEEANSIGPIVGIAVGALLCLMIVFIVGCIVTRRRRRGAARSHTSPIVSPRKSPRSTLDRTRAHTRSPPARSPPAHSPRSQSSRPSVEPPAKPRRANRSKRASMRKSYRRSAHLKGGLGTFAPVGSASDATDPKKRTVQYGVMPTLGATEMYGMIPKAQANPESNYLALAPDEEPANAEQYDVIPIPNTATPQYEMISVVDGGGGATADKGHYLELAPDEGF